MCASTHPTMHFVEYVCMRAHTHTQLCAEILLLFDLFLPTASELCLAPSLSPFRPLPLLPFACHFATQELTHAHAQLGHTRTARKNDRERYAPYWSERAWAFTVTEQSSLLVDWLIVFGTSPLSPHLLIDHLRYITSFNLPVTFTNVKKLLSIDDLMYITLTYSPVPSTGLTYHLQQREGPLVIPWFPVNYLYQVSYHLYQLMCHHQRESPLINPWSSGYHLYQLSYHL